MTTPSSARNRRPNRWGEGGKLRDEIIDAATRLLEQTGSDDAVTLRAIARQAGIAAPSIYAHFPDSAAIISTVVGRTFDRFTADLRAVGPDISDPVDRLYALGHGYLRFARDHPELYRILFARTQHVARSPAGNPASPPIHEAAGLEAFNILVDAIQACVDAGRSSSTRPVLDAIALWSALHGYSLLRDAVPYFPWPDHDDQLDAIIVGQARLDR